MNAGGLVEPAEKQVYPCLGSRLFTIFAHMNHVIDKGMEKKYEVVYICHDVERLGGAALSLMNLIHALREEVHPIVVLPGGAGEAVHDYFVAKGCECLTIPFVLNTTILPCFRTKVKFLPKFVRYHWHNGRLLRRLTTQLSGRPIRLVHSNSSVVTFGYHLARRLGVPHVWHLREFQDRDFGVRPFCGWAELKRKIYRSDAVIAISGAVYRHWQLERACRAYCMTDAVRPASDVAVCLDKEKYIVFCAAGLTDRKGTHWAVEAFAQSGLAAQGYVLKLIGACNLDYRKRLEALAVQWKVDQAVEFVGFCADVRPYLLRATAFLMCSQDEGLGRVTVEAFFYGCPVVARNSGGTPEFVRHGVNGFLYDNVSECAALLRRMPAQNFARLADEAHRTAVEEFSEEAYARKLRPVYALFL